MSLSSWKKIFVILCAVTLATLFIGCEFTIDGTVSEDSSEMVTETAEVSQTEEPIKTEEESISPEGPTDTSEAGTETVVETESETESIVETESETEPVCEHHDFHIDVMTPTCTQEGYSDFLCNLCGYTERTVLDAIPHSEADEKIIAITHAVEPTCTEVGYTEGRQCVFCMEYISGHEEIPAKGHSKTYTEKKEPTCTAQGCTQGTFCKTCGEVFEAVQIVPPRGHTPVADPAKAPTCTETGLTEGSHCGTCEAVLTEQKIIRAKGHTAMIQQGKEATCTQEGLSEGRFCKTCGKVLQEQAVIPAAGHTPFSFGEIPASCTDEGRTAVVVCSVCEITLSGGETVSPLGHTEVQEEGIEATCTQTGMSGRIYCTVCLTVLKESEELAKLPHEIVDGSCIHCGTPEPMSGLAYESFGDGTCSVSLGTNRDVDLVIPSVSPDGDRVVEIAPSGFMGGYHIETLTISEGIERIGREAFLYCEQLNCVSIPSTVTVIDTFAFFNCLNLHTVSFAENSRLETIESYAFGHYRTFTSTMYPGPSIWNFEIPDSVRYIGEESLTNARIRRIPSSVETVEYMAFEVSYEIEYAGTVEQFQKIHAYWDDMGFVYAEYEYNEMEWEDLPYAGIYNVYMCTSSYRIICEDGTVLTEGSRTWVRYYYAYD